MTTTEERATAFKAAATTSRVTAYDADDIPQTLPADWIEVGLMRTAGGNDRLCGRSATSAHYVTIGVGGGSVSDVRRTHDVVRSQLEGRAVLVGDTHTSPVRFYAEDPVEYVKELSRYWQLRTYSYAI